MLIIKSGHSMPDQPSVYRLKILINSLINRLAHQQSGLQDVDKHKNVKELILVSNKL